MKRITGIFKDIFPSLNAALIAGFIGVCAGMSVYIGTLQRHFFSKTYFAYAILIAAVVTILAAWLRKRFLTRAFLSLGKPVRIFALLISVLLSLVLLANTQIQPLYYLLPDTQMEIRIPIGDIPEGEESARLLWIQTGQGYVHYTNMDIYGDWERVEKNIVFSPNQEVVITWKGKVGHMTEIAFRQTHYDQAVFITWNGDTKEYNLNQPKQPNIVIKDQFNIPVLYHLPFDISFSVSMGFILFFLLMLLGRWNPPVGQGKKSKKWAWLVYMLPMLVVWTFSLLVFYPGFMSKDSFAQWNQGLSGQFNDWQSAFYSMLLAGLMRIWYTPAVVTIIQIVLMAALVAFGLKALQEQGVNKIVLWAISFLFALSPINNLYTITVWRDIPYALAILWLVIILLRIFLSEGEWILRLGWLWLALSGFMIAILRQNGIPAAFGLLAILPLVYRRRWKYYLGSAILCLVLFLLFKGPVYSMMNVDRSKSGQSNLILLHHIAAHLNANTELTAEEEDYLNSFLPTSDWNYYCCYVGTISYDDNFARGEFLTNSAQNRALALDLFMRDPLVDIRHTACSGELVWRFRNNQCFMKSTHSFNSWATGKVSWVIRNDDGVIADSQIPLLVQPYADLLRKFGFRDDLLVIYLRPALYFYLAVFFISVLQVRTGSFKALLISLPLVIQSAVLLLVSYAPALRYQYGTYLAGLFLIGLIFLPRNESGRG
jgi:hypothetical protein